MHEDEPALDVLRAHGVLAQLDDFGTGFRPCRTCIASRSPASDRPQFRVRAGRGFARRERGRDPAIVALSNSLGIEIIAEGVETIGQRDRLRELGCTYAQGFLFGRPAPPDR